MSEHDPNSSSNSGVPWIAPHEIQSEAEEVLGSGQCHHGLGHQDVLGEIMEALEPVDFHAEAKLNESAKIPQSALIVIVVQQVLRMATALGVGLCRSTDYLYSYNGAYWKLIDRSELEAFLGKAAAKLGVEEITAEFHVFRASLLKQFFAVAYLPTPELAVGKILINLLNGTFEIVGNQRVLREFTREDFLTYQLPFSYEANAVCPKWRTFLDRVLPDQSSQAVLAEYFAYIFTTLKLEKTLLLFGTGANGKSVVFDVLTALLGRQNISHFSLHSLTHEYSRACLANKLLNYASEISSRLESDVFKKLTSGEPVEARLPYGQPFIMYRYGRLAFNCNELPRDVEPTTAFFRRFLIIPFTVFIPEEERNPNLAKEIIDEELSGVFNWVLMSLDRLIAQGNFSPCEAAESAVKDYRKESDSVALFVEEAGYHKVSCKGEATLLSAVYVEYRTFCTDNGYRAVSSATLRKRLEVLGFDCPKTNAGRLLYAAKAGKDF